MEVEPRLKIFLSHAHEEAKLAIILKERIKQDFLGLVKVFASADRGDLHPAADWLSILKRELSEAGVHAVLCSARSLQHPWVNIELGGALFRVENPPPILPLCHSKLDINGVDLPIRANEAITISDVDGLSSLYNFLASQIKCLPPSNQLDSLANDIRAFEEEYKVSTSRQEESERLLATGNGTMGETIKNPKVLCISSRQLEEIAKADFEMIRKALPVNLYHEVVVTSQELREQLGTKSFDIVHAALYICPVTGDLIFDDVEPETRATRAEQPDRMKAEDFAKLVDVADTSLLVVITPEPFGFVSRLLPHTNIVFPSSFVEPQALAKWLGIFYELLADSYSLSEACKRASAQSCSCMRLYPKLVAESSMAYPSDPGVVESDTKLAAVRSMMA
jgi:hypothetical protein